MENEFTRGHTHGSGCLSLSLFFFFCIFGFLCPPPLSLSLRPSPCNSHFLSSLFLSQFVYGFIHAFPLLTITTKPA